MLNTFDENDPNQVDGIASCAGGAWCNIIYVPFDPNANSYGKAVKIFSDYHNYLKDGINSKGYIGNLINHEIGHTLSLRHSWGYGVSTTDFCDLNPTLGYDETPYNNNCWVEGDPSTTYNGQPDPFTPCIGVSCCDQESEISNNMMDYNNVQRAVTPCQISRMHSDLDNQWGNTYVNSCNGCMPSNSFFYLPTGICLTPTAKIELDGRGSWNNTGYAIKIDEVAFIGSNISIGGSFTTFSFGTVGLVNLRNLYTFQTSKIYRVELITTNSCANDASVKYITTQDPQCNLGQEEPPTEEGRVINISGQVQAQSKNELVDSDNQFHDLAVAPNPAKNQIEVVYQSTIKGRYKLSIVNLYGQEVIRITETEHFEAGLHTIYQEVNNLSSGTYILLLETPNNRITQKIMIVK